MDGQHSAQAATLASPELLEEILLRLGMEDLLVSAQRVCRHWFTVITSSPRLQQALFFRPVSSTWEAPPSSAPSSKEGRAYTERVIRSQNPLLRKFFGPLFFGGGSNHVRANAFAQLTWFTGESGCGEYSIGIADHEDRRRAFTRSGASWRYMLVSQPPPPLLACVRMKRIPRWPVFEVEKDLRSEPSWASSQPPLFGVGRMSWTHLRMGLLYDFVQYHAGHHFLNSLYLRITWAHPQPTLVHDYIGPPCKAFLKKTPIVVEFEDWDDSAQFRPEPVDVQAWDRQFRCEDFQPVEVEEHELEIED